MPLGQQDLVPEARVRFLEMEGGRGVVRRDRYLWLSRGCFRLQPNAPAAAPVAGQELLTRSPTWCASLGPCRSAQQVAITSDILLRVSSTCMG